MEQWVFDNYCAVGWQQWERKCRSQLFLLQFQFVLHLNYFKLAIVIQMSGTYTTVPIYFNELYLPNKLSYFSMKGSIFNLILCRTAEEFSDGHATGAINIPYMFRIGSGSVIYNQYSPFFEYHKFKLLIALIPWKYFIISRIYVQSV